MIKFKDLSLPLKILSSFGFLVLGWNVLIYAMAIIMIIFGI